MTTCDCQCGGAGAARTTTTAAAASSPPSSSSAAGHQKSTAPLPTFGRGGGGSTAKQHQDQGRCRLRRRPYLLRTVAFVAAVGLVSVNVTLTDPAAWWWGDGASRRHVASPSYYAALLFMVSEESDHQARRIREMRDALHRAATKGNDKRTVQLVVVWDNSTHPDCPSRYRKLTLCLQKNWTDLSAAAATKPAPSPTPTTNNGSLPAAAAANATILSNATLAAPPHNKFSHRGYAQETAVRWSIQNLHSYKYFWYMEQDVHYTDVSVLVDVITRPSTADLLHHGPIFSETGKSQWHHVDKVKRQAGNSFDGTPIHWSMFNLFRLSAALLRGVDEIYRRNSERWIFFEALLPTTAAHFNLTTEDWTRVDRGNITVTKKKKKKVANSTPAPSYRFRYRPCFMNFTSPGIYHPAKPTHDGKIFRPCTVDNAQSFL